MPHKIGAYIRVSTEEQAAVVDGSLDNQRYRIKSFVDIKNTQEKKWGEIVDFYVDDGYSAKDTKRPQYQRILNDLTKGKIDLILVTDLSRLSRNMADFCNLLGDLKKYNAQFFSIKEQFESTTAVGKMMVQFMIVLAEFEREQTSERVALGCHSRGMRGLMNGGRAILGFDKHDEKTGVYVVNKTEVEKVNLVFDTFLSSGSRGKAAKLLNQIGLKPKENSPTAIWTSKMVGQIVTNAAYVGYHEVNKRNKDEDQSKLKAWQKYHLAKASWPAIIDEEKFYRAQYFLEEAMKRERSRLSTSEERNYCLSGFLKCGQCGEPLVGQASHGEQSVHRYYGHTVKGRVHGCKIQRISADVIEEAIFKHLRFGLVDAGYFKGIENRIATNAESKSKGTKVELKLIEDRLQELSSQTANAFGAQASGKLSEEALKLLSETLDQIAKQKNQLVKRRDQLAVLSDDLESPAQSVEYLKERVEEFCKGFSKSTAAQKKRLLRRTIKAAIVMGSKVGLSYYGADPEVKSGSVIELFPQKKNTPTPFKAVSGDSFTNSNLTVQRSDIGLFTFSSWKQ